MANFLRRSSIIPKDKLEEEAYRALQKILKNKEIRESVAKQLIELAQMIDDDDDPSHQVMHSAS